jgi:hypothetical protein
VEAWNLAVGVDGPGEIGLGVEVGVAVRLGLVDGVNDAQPLNATTLRANTAARARRLQVVTGLR